MSFDNNYTWTGRVDNEETKGLAYRLHELIQPFNEQKDALSIIGFCSDEGVARNKGRIGAKSAPNALRSALANLPWSESKAVVDAGNVICDNQDLESAHQNLADKVTLCLDHGHLPVVLGGGHEVAYGSWLGLKQHLSNENTKAMPNIGIINFRRSF